MHTNSPESLGIGIVLIGGALLFMFMLCLLVYIYKAYCLWNISKKARIENNWMAWVPIANIILMLQIAKKPTWWIILFFVPVASIVVIILTWMEIAKTLRKPDWLGILMIIPIANLFALGYLTFSKDTN